jgi:hypothetical protein
MGNEQSQEARTQHSSESESDDFDLSQIPDTRRNRSPTTSKSPTKSREAGTPSVAPPPEPPSRRSQMPAKRTHRRKVKKITQPRANSKKKRKQSRTTDTTQSDSESEEAAEADVDPEAMAQQEEQRRIADEGLLRERMRRVRETEPEMFDDYALSDDSENENHGQEGAPQSNNQESGSEAIGDDDPSAAGIQDTRLIESDEARTDSSQGLRVESVESPSGSEHSLRSVALPEAVHETPFVPPQKRKRSHASLSPSSPRKTKSNKKQRSEDVRSSGEATDVEVRSPLEEAEESADRSDGDQDTIFRRRQSIIDDFAQPYEKGSDLRHPIYNPKSPRQQGIAVLVPTTNTKVAAHNHRMENGESSRAPQVKRLQLKRRKANSSEASMGSGPYRKDVWSLDDIAEPEGLATSTARRIARDRSGDTVSDVEVQSPGSGPEPVQEAIADGAKSSEDRHDAEHQSSSPSATSQPTAAQKRPKKAKIPARSSPATASRPKLPAGSLRCPRCNKQFTSEKARRKHMEDPTVHDNLHGCDHCDEEFATKAALNRHRKEKEHGGPRVSIGSTGSTGRFTQEEADKLDRWRDLFCDDHGINDYDFNEMMTASTKKGDKHWPYKFITKRDFQQEYYAVLPERDRRSMLRIRSRYQNVDKSKFTNEDDADIVRLVEEIGQKWIEIGERLTRDPEKVRLRYKNKLMFGDSLVSGVWDKEEEKRYREAIKAIRLMSRSGAAPEQESFNWTAVSSMVKTRTPQQCANHWRALHGTNVKGVWVDSGLDIIYKGKSPSKMEQRLAGKKLSAKLVEDSDSEEANGDKNEHEERPGVAGDLIEGQDDDSGSGPGAAKIDDSSGLPKSDANGTSEDEGLASNQGTPRRKPALEKTNKTPAHALSVSQAFGETQAHSSDMKKSAKRRQTYGPSQEQPSPGIAVQVRPERSPEFDRRLQEVLNPTSENDGEETGEDGSDAPEDEDQALSSDSEDNSQEEHEDYVANAARSDEQAVAKMSNGERRRPMLEANLTTDFIPSPSKKKYSSRREEQRKVRWPEDSDSDHAADSD